MNDRADLMEAEESAQRRLIEQHALRGVTFLPPETTTIEAGVRSARTRSSARGSRVLGGHHASASGCEIGPHTTLIGDATRRRRAVAHSYAVEAEVERRRRASVRSPTCGPAPSSREGAKVGTFVEVKNSDIGAGAKVPHLSYIGDADVGEGSNLGASTITANYDGSAASTARRSERA